MPDESGRPFEITCVLASSFGKQLAMRAFGKRLFDRCRRRTHPNEIEAMEEIAENFDLFTKPGVSTTGLLWRIGKSPILVSGSERIVEIVVETTARQNEFPSLHSVMIVGCALEAGLVVTNHLVERVVLCNSVRRVRVMKVEDRQRGMGLSNFLRTVGHVLRNEMLLGEIFLRVGDDVRDVRL